jgi:hypothetical protein
MIIPTDGGLRPGDAKWEPMREWLTANRFDIDWVPTDALIEIRDGTCLGVEYFVRDISGRVRLNPATDDPIRRIEWHPMIQAPPPILLPEEAS